MVRCVLQRILWRHSSTPSSQRRETYSMAEKTRYPENVFNVGELVRVNEMTHQDPIPHSRVGVVIKVYTKVNSEERNGIYGVLFASSKGSHEMTFWHGFLERVEK